MRKCEKGSYITMQILIMVIALETKGVGSRFCAYHCGNRCCSHIKCSMNAGYRPMDILKAQNSRILSNEL